MSRARRLSGGSGLRLARVSMVGDVTAEHARRLGDDLRRMPINGSRVEIDLRAVTYADDIAVRRLVTLLQHVDVRVWSLALVGVPGPVLRALEAEGIFDRAVGAFVKAPEHLEATNATRMVFGLERDLLERRFAEAGRWLAPDVVWRLPASALSLVCAQGREEVNRQLSEHFLAEGSAYAIEADGMVLTGERRPHGPGTGHVIWTTDQHIAVGLARRPEPAL